jgi:polar amino acid transport system permease protein
MGILQDSWGSAHKRTAEGWRETDRERWSHDGLGPLAAYRFRLRADGRMNYVFEFGQVFAAWDELLAGALRTLWLSAASMVIGLIVAIAGALGKTSGPRWLRWIIDAYIEVIRNTPFLIQIFMVFFGLPAIGIRLEADQAALLAMVINVGAYGIEIIRAGIESIHKGQIEAGKALGLHSMQIFRHIILKPALQAIYPSLTSQFILLMLNSSVCSAIAASELTAAANDIQARNFRSFEVYFVVTAIYFVLSLMFWGIFAWVERTFLRQPAAR